MKEQLNLSGEWAYQEDYGSGVSKGTLKLTHQGDVINGTFYLEENTEGETPFKLEEEVRGKIEDNKLYLNGISYTITDNPSEEEFDYFLDNWEGQIMSNDLIVGEAEDEQGVLGIFSLRRI
ncbi:hypothetical protein [Sediminitomix flava]|uniref:Lipocalin-like protein n=1 Tax=Sediminitomix flava TaxID=379075 RepID=A0A315ZC86_SEDFL|nr:hypothetical protein [Sediminitomix flava]PWJ42922.1 hypothetical protein BC781_102468 [Sediminitomix flava]